MSKYLRLITVLALVCLSCRAQAQPVAIIPEPVSTQWHDGHFLINEHTLLIADDQDQSSVKFFNDYLQQLYGLRLHVAGPGQQPASGYIRLIRTPSADGGASGNAASPEGQYTLEAKPENITISSSTGPGIFYGIQTLIQLLPLSPFVMTDHGPAISPTSDAAASAGGTSTSTACQRQPASASRPSPSPTIPVLSGAACTWT